MNTIYKLTILLLLVLVYHPSLAQSGNWQQQGLDINAEASSDFSGNSVSMPDANTIAIGAPYNDGNASVAGHVRIYSWNGSAWTQKGGDIDGQAIGDYSGHSVSMPDANTVAIGSIGSDQIMMDGGQVRVFSWNGSSWIQKGADINGDSIFDQLGWSVSMPDPNTVAVGAIGHNGNSPDIGQVRIYSWNGSAWVQKGSYIDGQMLNEIFGYSISMPDSNTIAVGAQYNSDNGNVAGEVRIYVWIGSAWVQKGIDIGGEAANDLSGTSVSMPDANTVAIGAPFNDGSGFNAGQARIYYWNGSAWTQKGQDIDGGAPSDESGWSVSMPDANTVAIGAPDNDAGGFKAGQVHVYSWNGSSWVQKGLDINQTAPYDKSGYSVSMPDTNIVGIGAIDYTGSIGGEARIFAFNQFSSVTQTSSIGKSISIYPNPCSGILRIEVSDFTTIIITNSLGQIVFEEKISAGQTTLNLQHLVAGLYVVDAAGVKEKVIVK
jgi:Secretion system C-terminal sorting domain